VGAIALHKKVQAKHVRKSPELPARRKSARPPKPKLGLWAPQFHT
jgi:hypothetical protein